MSFVKKEYKWNAGNSLPTSAIKQGLVERVRTLKKELVSRVERWKEF